LDFHFYCRQIVHWNLPGNPIDIEQREGRVNRFKGLTIRQQIARKFGSFLHAADLSESVDPGQARPGSPVRKLRLTGWIQPMREILNRGA